MTGIKSLCPITRSDNDWTDPGSVSVTGPKNRPTTEQMVGKEWMEKRDVKQYFQVLQRFS